MLRKRSRAVMTSNQGWVPPEKSSKPTSFFFNSPSFFKDFFTISPETDATTMSPTSILDTKPFSVLANTLFPQKIQTPKTISENKHFWEPSNSSIGIGIALGEVENSSDKNKTTTLSDTQQQKRKLVVFGSQLRIQVPPSSVFPCFSPSEFGSKTPRSNLGQNGEKSGEIGREDMSMIDIEQSEDYTCVISHGPNPKTTHIFGNSIVQSCCRFDDGSSSFPSIRNGHLSVSQNSIPSLHNFLSFCHQCKKHLGEGKDIYMYRGERGFCSEECRCQGMLFDRLES